MNKRLLIALAALAAVFGISVAGASVLNLSGSDRAPGSGTTEAACAGDLVVQAPVKQGGTNNNKIVNVYVKGDFTTCEGQTIRIETDLNGIPAYAFRIIEKDLTQLTFFFDAKTGDFTDTSPTVVDGQLVAAGKLVGPGNAKDFGQIDVLIAGRFE